MWGVSKKESFQHQSYDKTWGISNAQQYFPWNTKYKGCKYESIDCTHFYSSNIEVDILFDCDKRKLKLCVVGKLSDNKTNREPSIWNIKHPTDDKCGWVPHLNLGVENLEFKIAKIPIDWYGQKQDGIFDTINDKKKQKK